jgi:uncharacterized cupin superfamily protein
VVGEIHKLREDADGQLTAGLWRVTPEQAPGTNDVPMHANETVYIIQGHITVEVVGGDTLELRAGSLASFEKGALTRWTVHAPTLEFYIYS